MSRPIGEYTYNANGQRVIKKIEADKDLDGEEDPNEARYTIFHYDLSGRLIEETSLKGKLRSDYIYLNSTPLAFIKKKGKQEETYFYHNDHLGAPRAMTDTLQTIAWRADFDPFGRLVNRKAPKEIPDPNDDGPTEPPLAPPNNRVKNSLRFPGQYFDSETGLNYNYFRNYDSKTGRYREADPIGLAGGDTNLYAYVGNNSVNWIDLDGLMKLPSDPSGLGPEWKLDPSYKYPHGQAYIDSSGRQIEWHPAQPGVPGQKGKDHWHDKNNFRDNPKHATHLPPGSEIPDPAPLPKPPAFFRGPGLLPLIIWIPAFDCFLNPSSPSCRCNNGS